MDPHDRDLVSRRRVVGGLAAGLAGGLAAAAAPAAADFAPAAFPGTPSPTR